MTIAKRQSLPAKYELSSLRLCASAGNGINRKWTQKARI